MCQAIVAPDAYARISAELVSGTITLNNGMAEIHNGIFPLKNGTSELPADAIQLKDGAISRVTMGANIKAFPMRLLLSQRVFLGAVVAAKFANKWDIKKLNYVIGCILLVLGIATICAKLFLEQIIYGVRVIKIKKDLLTDLIFLQNCVTIYTSKTRRSA